MNSQSSNPVRAWLSRQRQDLRWMWGLRGLRPRVLWFQWRARRVAWRTGDRFSISSATRPAETRVLLELARGRRCVVELGTATAWTAITLALDDPERRVVTYDPLARPEPLRYLKLVKRGVRDRVQLVIAPGSAGPVRGEPVDLLYIDSSHERGQTIEEVRTWQPHLRSGGLLLFDDYTHEGFPGIRQAIEELGLDGTDAASSSYTDTQADEQALPRSWPDQPARHRPRFESNRPASRSHCLRDP
jgi:predicted O-methyltransferase YrrM